MKEINRESSSEESRSFPTWIHGEPPMDGTYIVAIGSVLFSDETTGRHESTPFSGIVRFVPERGYWEWETGMAVVACPDHEQLKIFYWSAVPQLYDFREATGAFSVSPELKRRFDQWADDANFRISGRALAWAAYLAGVDAKADQLTVKQLEEDVARMEEWDLQMARWKRQFDSCGDKTAGERFEFTVNGCGEIPDGVLSGVRFPNLDELAHPMASIKALPPYEESLRNLANTESSDEWSYDSQILENDPGVMLLAGLYEKPILKVANDVGKLRREWVKEYLAESAG